MHESKRQKMLGGTVPFIKEGKFYIMAASLKPHAPEWIHPYVRKRVHTLLLNLNCAKVKIGKRKLMSRPHL
jgi:hypothetical protein